ncbi:IS3 family transposase [Paenibacillus sambharensis]|uniref:IS3 family transposase n=1 Tax=Paenibacillus sambharensis TaxID=1803190 RepID=A0A2W1L6S2_9BACL|nr:IS3 family transposase [Paenibacillus sambharensis]PZD94488.1 IS3 family transposase [Paenibacillus sambharensis]PZD94519.1 IS3 family transposase [Paenibacillus sambharensis]PZD94544.1 IS3 family transposase [Paenibacillus sambharensis]PZD94547.1 IS3 family transposase [Paenibacillus sambharensis]PZD94768.1 IS3 family transposase [Paenibacillus sambharensis]
MPRNKLNALEKLAILQEIEAGHIGVRATVKKYGIAMSTLANWQRRYRLYGTEGLEVRKHNRSYSEELKHQAVKDYLEGKLSQNQVIDKYGIACRALLFNWIKKYTGHSSLKACTGGTTAMTKGRKTTWQERIDIVLYCLANGQDYTKTAMQFQVSYQQVYGWVRKYAEGGQDALQDGRGRAKAPEELTEVDEQKYAMKKLEYEIERLRAEKCFLKKVTGVRKEVSLSQHRQENIYLAIQAVQRTESMTIQLLCGVAGIPRSSYYKWLNRTPSSRELENRKLTEMMMSMYEKVEGTFGYRQLTLHMRREWQHPINHKRVQRLMRIKRIQSVIRRKKKKYERSTPQQVAENVLNRKFQAEAPNEKWVTDVTEFKYGNSQKAYLSAILDLHDKSIVSYVLGHSNNNPLVFQTLDLALQAAPNSKPLIHSDRGYQYTSLRFKEMLDKANMTQSMSRVGRCIDNGPMESFWGTLKCEKYYLHTYRTYEELKKDIDDYIHFYNNERLQAKLNGLSPIEFRTKAV